MGDTTLEISDETSVIPINVFIDGESVTEMNLDADRNLLVLEMHESGSSQKVEDAITNLSGIQSYAGRIKSKLIHDFSLFWVGNNPDGDFAEFFTQKNGGKVGSVHKHILIGEFLLDDEVPAKVKKLSNAALLSVARAKKSGYDLSDSWDKISMAGDEGEVNDIIHAIKGTEKREGSLDLILHADGSIAAWEGGIWVNAGWLNFADREDKNTPEDKKKILVKAISRIEKNSGMRIK